MPSYLHRSYDFERLSQSERVDMNFGNPIDIQTSRK